MTSLVQALTGVTRLALDTAPIIYFVEEHPRYITRIAGAFEAVAAGRLTGVTSALTLTEVLVQPIRHNEIDLQTEYMDLLLNSAHFETWPIDAAIGERAAQLRAQFNVRTPDALQLATALVAGCQAFLTNDARLKRITELSVLIVDELDE